MKIKRCENLGGNKGCENLDEIFFGAKIRGTGKFKGCENFHGKFKGCENIRRKSKGFEKFSLFSEKHSNRVSGLKKDRPLRGRGHFDDFCRGERTYHANSKMSQLLMVDIL